MIIKNVRDEYFEWLSDLVCGERYSKDISYRKLLMHLHNTEFVYLIPNDENRADDGINLRRKFSLMKGYDYIPDLIGPCSVLEMMVALSIRCEESIMDDASIGDRTGQWFWGMIVNLGLGSMIDVRYDRDFVDEVLTTFLNRDYSPTGKGGLFTILNANTDLRNVEIWYQLCWYLDNIT